MPSVVLAILLHTWIASDKCEIYSQRQRTQSPYPRIYLAYVFTYAAAKVLLFSDICKKNRRKKTHYLLRRCVPYKP